LYWRPCISLCILSYHCQLYSVPQVKLSNEYELQLDDLQSRWVWLLYSVIMWCCTIFIRLSATQLEVDSLQSSNFHMKEQLESLDKVCTCSVPSVCVCLYTYYIVVSLEKQHKITNQDPSTPYVALVVHSMC